MLHVAKEVTAETVNNYHKGNKSDKNTWVIRWHVNDDGDIEPSDMNNESIYLKNELCQALFEFAPNQMILYAKPGQIFIIRNW